MPPKTPPAASHPALPETASFEQALERLQTIVDELESGSLSLEESLSRYEEGVRLSRQLSETLEQAEKRIEKLVERQGQPPTTEPMELDTRRAERSAREDELPF